MADPLEVGPLAGSCLCGGVRFEIDAFVGPFELCHCTRCRKRGGAAALPMIGVRARDYRLLVGAELIRTYEAPVLYRPPAYRSTFCSRCGSPVPPAAPEGEWFEVPAGILDGDPGVSPDRHIFVEFRPAWDARSDGLPEWTIRDVAFQRRGVELPADFELRRHGQASGAAGDDGAGDDEADED